MVPLMSIYAGGVLTVLLAVFHTLFYKRFNWAADFEKITVLNRRILYTVHMALLLLFFIFGALSLIYAGELSRSTGLALGFNLLYALFWGWRTLWQFIYFKREKGKKIPPAGLMFIALFILLFMAYMVPVLYRFA